MKTLFRLVGGTDVDPALTESARPKRRHDRPSATVQIHLLENPPTATANGHLRQWRREAWRTAEAATRYWRVRIEFDDAVRLAQQRDIPEGGFHPPIVDRDYRSPIVKNWRAAFVKQLLTPAWDVASVKWKQLALARGQHKYTDVKQERIERSIADDLAFLAAHPVRQSKCRKVEANA